VKIKLSATFEGKCDICGKETIVFTAGDEDTKKVVTICKEDADKLGSMTTADVIEKYGHVDEKSFDEGIKIERKSTAA